MSVKLNIIMDQSLLTRHLLSFAILFFLIVHTIGIVRVPILDTLERFTYDFRLNIANTPSIDKRIVIIDIDDKSLKAIGRWPWQRNVLAKMVDQLFDHYNVTVVGFDVLFAEEDRSSGLEILKQLSLSELKNNTIFLNHLKKITPSLEYDKIFSRSIINRNVVLGYFFRHNHKNNKTVIGQLPDPAILIDEELKDIPFAQPTGVGGSLKIFQNNALHGGFIDLALIDDDGVIRSIPMLQKYQNVLYESLSLAMIRATMDFPFLELEISDEYNSIDIKTEVNIGLEAIKFGGFKIPVDERGSALIPYQGASGSFRYVSAIDVLNKIVPEHVLKNAFILVGTTAAGLLDLRSTPVQSLYPGVEIHANMIAGILDGSIKHKPAYLQGASIISLITIWLLLTLLSFRHDMIFYFSVVITLTLAIIVGVQHAWTEEKIVLPIVDQLLLISLLVGHQILFSYFVENKSKRLLANVFKQYIPPELVNELGGKEDDYAIGGETREMTVMFADIRGFTAISEKMDPKELTLLMNRYFTEMTSAIQHNRGTIDKYIGDAIMAFWGAPIQDNNHAQQSLNSTMEMLDKLTSLKREFSQRDWPEISIGIGVNTGPMYVGNIVSEFRKSYTVLGDAVNLGSRVEALTKEYGVSIIVTESTFLACENYIFRELDRVRVVGKNEAITLYQPVCVKNIVTNEITDELEQYHSALSHYRNQRWQQAIDILKLLNQTSKLAIYSKYLSRCEHYHKNAPDKNWDGVFTYTSK